MNTKDAKYLDETLRRLHAAQDENARLRAALDENARLRAALESAYRAFLEPGDSHAAANAIDALAKGAE